MAESTSQLDELIGQLADGSAVLPVLVAGRTHSEGVESQLDSPGSEGRIRRYRVVGADVAARAAQAAAAALPRTAGLSRYERAIILRKIATKLESYREELGRSICWEVGKSLRDSVGEVDRCIATLQTAADAVAHLAGAEEPLDAVPVGAGRLGLTVWEPIGVVAAICGFNFPLLLAVHKVAAAIGAGCPVLVKPSDRTPFTTLALGRAAVEAGWPEDAISVLNGGPELGDALIRNDHVRLVSFTGSSAVGARIAQTAGSLLKRCVLELGSNAATIVAADADIRRAANACAIGATASTGQSCISVQRILVHRDVAEGFIAELVGAVKSLRRGHPDDPSTELGRVVSDGEQDRIRAMVDEAVARGALVCAGGEVDELGMQPTIIADVPPQARICSEEVFGPVAVVIRFQEIDEAVAIANSVPYGLSTGIFTESVTTAFDVARRLETGVVHINDSSNFRPDNMPYGGVKHSGYGKEGPAHAMREMSNLKVITLPLRGGKP